jgi:hypothetical protein
MNVKGLFTCILLSGMLISCSQQRAGAAEDLWYKPPPSESPLYWTWPELDRTRIHEVTESKEPDAERLLQDASIVELTDQEAVELIGKALADAPGTKPYLTRGLYLNRGTGRFSVYVLEDQLVVHHGSLGSSAVPMKRQALVLQLEQSPAEVFVTCSMAK